MRLKLHNCVIVAERDGGKGFFGTLRNLGLHTPLPNKWFCSWDPELCQIGIWRPMEKKVYVWLKEKQIGMAAVRKPSEGVLSHSEEG